MLAAINIIDKIAQQWPSRFRHADNLDRLRKKAKKLARKCKHLNFRRAQLHKQLHYVERAYDRDSKRLEIKLKAGRRLGTLVQLLGDISEVYDGVPIQKCFQKTERGTELIHFSDLLGLRSAIISNVLADEKSKQQWKIVFFRHLTGQSRESIADELGEYSYHRAKLMAKKWIVYGERFNIKVAIEQLKLKLEATRLSRRALQVSTSSRLPDGKESPISTEEMISVTH